MVAGSPAVTRHAPRGGRCEPEPDLMERATCWRATGRVCQTGTRENQSAVFPADLLD